MVKPILLYDCEIWRYGNNEILERVQLTFCKLLLKSKAKTHSSMIYGELGTYPIDRYKVSLNGVLFMLILFVYLFTRFGYV
jgi:hypothetical protein